MFSKADTTWKCGLFYLYEQYGYVFTDINGEMICYLHASHDIFNVCDLHEHYFVSSKNDLVHSTKGRAGSCAIKIIGNQASDWLDSLCQQSEA